MIIDAHCHIGHFGKMDMTKDLPEAIKKYKIDYALFSSGDAVEVTDKMVLLEKQKKQIDVCLETLNFSRKHPNFLALLWLKPLTEGVNEELVSFIEENRNAIYGLKFHPFYSNMPFDNPKYRPYIELARKYHLPIQIHTANDENSSVKAVYEVAKKYPDVNFILAHLNLGSDNKEAISYVKELPNLYGDTAWVSAKNVVYAIKECGPTKIMFGTDNPIDGVDTYLKYQEFFNELKEELTKEEYDGLMYKNAIRIFNIKKIA